MSSSSDEDDEVDAAQLAALRSVAIDSAAVVVNASVPAPSHRKAKSWQSGNDNDARMTDVKQGKETSGLKLYQTRLQDLLYKHLDTTVGASFYTHPLASAKPAQISSTGVNDSEEDFAIRLFRRAPPGIVIHQPARYILAQATTSLSGEVDDGTSASSASSIHQDVGMLMTGQSQTVVSRVRPKLRQTLTVDEDSDEHLAHLQAAAVDGETVRLQADLLTARVLARAQAKQAIAEEATKREEERVANLKRERGEKWLPAISKLQGIPAKAPELSGGVDSGLKSCEQKKKKKRSATLAVGNSELIVPETMNVVQNGTTQHVMKKQSNWSKGSQKVRTQQVGTVQI